MNDAYNSPSPESLGNPWFITSLWLAEYYIEIGENQKADNIIKWTENHMMPSGVLAEQFDPTHPDRPVSVAPLVWSQAEYAMTVISMYFQSKGEKQQSLLRNQAAAKSKDGQVIKIQVVK